ncbi:MAG: hypothetical protein COS30_00140 [Candidatus Portnoybacteria bacterium CG02_land_8_20_14_3_00_45_8]|uniref:Uncharacterized protein n=1 Tax=Candidatus Portnoybacteria bacterium CG02_land_8_20_14_3_00_45_8 TaxID=1974807 RepID=A0A2M7D709_9BACT|nr:MAG: hypothetical protein AUK17_00745 [Parcubacteria group bacterium CG2_30_44_18]PIV38784.1 MAG: hypothetical protein COS30_00140 [Candidatus Portnoybacteria bacterium CG02_land_8_20_14_3_00_45_8]
MFLFDSSLKTEPVNCEKSSNEVPRLRSGQIFLRKIWFFVVVSHSKVKPRDLLNRFTRQFAFLADGLVEDRFSEFLLNFILRV